MCVYFFNEVSIEIFVLCSWYECIRKQRNVVDILTIFTFIFFYHNILNTLILKFNSISVYVYNFESIKGVKVVQIDLQSLRYLKSVKKLMNKISFGRSFCALTKYFIERISQN